MSATADSVMMVLQQLVMSMAAQAEENKKMMKILVDKEEKWAKDGGEKKDWKQKGIEGKTVDMFKKFHGGEIDWNMWADDFKIMVNTRSEEMGSALDFVRKLGKVDKEVLTTKEVDEEMALMDDNPLVKLDGNQLPKLSRELYRAIHMATEDEAKLIVRSVEEGDGLRAWGKLNAKYSQKTLTRMMRLFQECMYPTAAKVGELVSAALAWEGK